MLSRLIAGLYAIDRARDRRAALSRAMRLKPRLPDVSACVVRNGRLRCPAASGIVYTASFAMGSARSGGWGLASRVMSNPS